MANSTDSTVSKEPPIPHAHAKQDEAIASPEGAVRGQLATSISRLLKGKAHEWKEISNRTPLRLLDLPVDVLNLILKELNHTNDLTSLALTCSALYYTAVPYIYTRFDIVWPDSNIPTTESKSVDALTYGLATLCLGSKFAQRARWLGGDAAGTGGSQRFIDNQYAKHTKKFSLGNGPSDWVAEYMITKESGKMLGTLVALAVAKMVNLETFIWDMPTGVLSDIFMALASLQDAPGNSKLEKIWIRWHDNSAINGTPTMSSASSPHVQPVVPAGPPLVPPNPMTMGILATPTSSSAQMTAASPPRYSEFTHIEYPTFSVLPPLKSLTVLDIDEVAYLDEMSVLIERSKETLKELRVGISQKAHKHDFATTWDGSNLQQVDLNARWPGESTIGDKRLGGPLGVLVGRVYEIRPKGKKKAKYFTMTDAIAGASTAAAPAATLVSGVSDNSASQENAGLASTDSTAATWKVDQGVKRKRLEGKLRLHTLELERISLSMQVCTKALDWSVLTNLTIIDCVHHETLWKVLKKQFQPTPPSFGSPPGTPTQYHLALKKMHTDLTTQALINFIKETLAPNSLEVLFLQDRRRSSPPLVTIEQIFKGAIKRHRSSLRKLLLDSTDKPHGPTTANDGNRWRNWVLTSDMVAYITSGRMRNLRELAVAMHYKDWHPFLQRLPNIAQLRSLYLPYVQEHIGESFEPKELALQLVDIITLRPEIQLCYVGISTKCFEILETTIDITKSRSEQFSLHGNHQHHTGAISVIDVDDEDEVGDNDNSDGDETEDDDGSGTNVSANTDGDDEFTEVSDDAESDADSFQGPEHNSQASMLRLREILFYDDKVAIFKARHARL